MSEEVQTSLLQTIISSYRDRYKSVLMIKFGKVLFQPVFKDTFCFNLRSDQFAGLKLTWFIEYMKNSISSAVVEKGIWALNIEMPP